MLIFTKDSQFFIYIHIPKNCGKYMREKILQDENNCLVTSYWDIDADLDLAHIPYMKRYDFISTEIEYKYITNTRNPYDRVISAFFYINPNSSKDELNTFIQESLINYKFDLAFDYTIIHFYPQYLFLCDEML